MAAGNRILRRDRKVDAEVVERFRALPVANVSDAMSRMTAGGPAFGRCMAVVPYLPGRRSR